MSADRSTIELGLPRSWSSVIGTALRCYASQVLLFMTITAAVVIPWALVIWLVEDASLLNQRHGHSGEALVSLGIATLIVGPLVSALHVNALTDLGAGRRPQIRSVFARGLSALAVVAAAQVVASIGIFLACLCLVIPGLILMARLAVVPQIAALEHVNWTTCLSESWQRTRGHTFHILCVIIPVMLVLFGIDRTIGLLLPHRATALSLIVGAGVELVTVSVSALVTAVLYYDIQARQRTGVTAPEPAAAPDAR